MLYFNLKEWEIVRKMRMHDADSSSPTTELNMENVFQLILRINFIFGNVHGAHSTGTPDDDVQHSGWKFTFTRFWMNVYASLMHLSTLKKKMRMNLVSLNRRNQFILILEFICPFESFAEFTKNHGTFRVSKTHWGRPCTPYHSVVDIFTVTSRHRHWLERLVGWLLRRLSHSKINIVFSVWHLKFHKMISRFNAFWDKGNQVRVICSYPISSLCMLWF